MLQCCIAPLCNFAVMLLLGGTRPSKRNRLEYGMHNPWGGNANEAKNFAPSEVYRRKFLIISIWQIMQ